MYLINVRCFKYEDIENTHVIKRLQNMIETNNGIKSVMEMYQPTKVR